MRLSPSTAISLLALVISLGGAGYAATGGNFLLGLTNSATQRTALSANYDGAALALSNMSTGATATALTLSVATGRTPMKVNSTMKVLNLNADWLDGFSSASFVRVAIGGWHYIGDPGEPAFEGTWANVQLTVHLAAVTGQHAAFRIDNNHVVHITGHVQNGGIGTTIFKLPAAYCPYFDKVLPASSLGKSGTVKVFRSVTALPCNVTISDNGNGITDDNVSLDGISFPDASTDVLIAAGP